MPGGVGGQRREPLPTRLVPKVNVNSPSKTTRDLNAGTGGIYTDGNIEIAVNKSLMMGATNDSGNRFKLFTSGGLTYLDFYDALQFRSGASSSSTISTLSPTGALKLWDKLTSDTIESSLAYVSGFAGSGYRLINDNGEINLELDNLTVRNKLSAYEMEIREINAVNGGLMISAANGSPYLVSGTRFYFDEDGGSNPITFAVNDYVKAQQFTGSGIGSYVGKVTKVNHSSTLGSAYIDASLISGTPWDKMKLVQYGNSSDTARQNLIYITASDTNNPYIDFCAGVNTGSLSGKQKMRLGNLSGITDSAFGGALTGFGLYADNVYLNGKIVIASGSGYSNLSDKPTSLSSINSTESSKLSGIEAGATVGATSAQVTAISNAATTATWSGVSGAGKPADNADVTNYTDYRVSNSDSTNSVTTIPNPIGGKYNSAPVTGAIIITLPQSWTNTMMKFEVDVFNYSTSNSFTLKIGGYNYVSTPAWYNCFAQLIGSTTQNNRVRFGHNGTKCVIVIGETTTTWQYPNIAVKNFQAGYSNYAISQWETGWSVTVSSSLAGMTFTQDFADSLIDAKSIVGQGALATQDSVNWSSQITNKPTGVSLFNTPSGAGLYMDGTHLGYYSGSAWQSYIDNAGNCCFIGLTELGTASQNYAIGYCNTSIKGADIWENSLNGQSTLNINLKGYSGGQTQYRNTLIGDGKGSVIAEFFYNKLALYQDLVITYHDIIISGGDVSIGGKISTSGTITSANSMTATNFILSSDERLKENIVPINTKPINVNYKEFNLKSQPDQKRYGVIAQELQKTNPELVRTDESGMLSVAYIDLFVKEIASLKKEIKNLKEELNYFKNYNS
ncbi:MAG: tail fiber domain-containing protein [Bacteroidales bacterium]|nr:tail fiber domain-containing protein [Bacteroidales bacterium]